MQLKIPFDTKASGQTGTPTIDRMDNNKINRLDPSDHAFHDWYRFNLSFPPHLVRKYFKDFHLDEKRTVLDPFCGTGTTVLESKLSRIPAMGIEASPFAQLASAVKIDWEIDPEVLLTQAREVARLTDIQLHSEGINDKFPSEKHNALNSVLRKLTSEAEKLLLSGSISPLPLHKTLVLLEFLDEYREDRIYNHFLLGLAKALVFKISNLRFGPEVGVKKPKIDTPVVSAWLSEIRTMAKDLKKVQYGEYPTCEVLLGDSREINHILEPHSIDSVITSPPYPNEKDYTRTTRLESVVLGFISSLTELRNFKKSLIRSNTRCVYKEDDDDKWISNHSEIQEIAHRIEQRRIELGKTSGFEKQYHKVTRLYFGGMARHLTNLRKVLKKDASLAYVVGDQASFLRVMIRTGRLLGEIAESMGYEVLRIDLFRERFATATGEQLREEVVILRWPGFEA